MTTTGIFGNAATVILGSGFPRPTQLGVLPDRVLALLSLPKAFSIVCVDERVMFHLAEKSPEARSDTALFRWMADTSPSVVATPDYFLPGAKPYTFQLLKKVPAHDKRPTLNYMRCIINYCASDSRPPELKLHTIVLHNEKTVRPYVKRGVRVGA